MFLKYLVYFYLFAFSTSIFAEKNQTQEIFEPNFIEYLVSDLAYTDFINKCLADGKDINLCEFEFSNYVNHYLRSL
ncbi:hypothetical protein [Fluviispira vulneris]|uniref:hypothetical protein n=1 Tax=Fluviispira vulneris TaxID=2763012 RepID=UPI0016461E8F|nr:hypothetical protein [Fluviispira vulneris]